MNIGWYQCCSMWPDACMPYVDIHAVIYVLKEATAPLVRVVQQLKFYAYCDAQHGKVKSHAAIQTGNNAAHMGGNANGHPKRPIRTRQRRGLAGLHVTPAPKDFKSSFIQRKFFRKITPVTNRPAWLSKPVR